MENDKQYDRLKRQQGFALILVLGVLLIAAAITASIVARQENSVVWSPILDTKDQLATVEKALVAYQRAHHRLPLPAPRSRDFGTDRFHQEALSELETGYALPMQVQTAFDGGASSVMMPSGLQYVRHNTGETMVVGALPTQDLGLPRRVAEDAEGKFLTYAVAFSAVNPWDFGNAKGVIEVVDAQGKQLTDAQLFLVLSHGKDAKGGWSARGGFEGRSCGGGIAVGGTRAAGNASAAIDAENCDLLDTRFVANSLELVAGSSYFDDQLLQGERDTLALGNNRPCLPQTIAWGAGNMCSGMIPPPGVADSSTSATPKQVIVTHGYGSATVECNDGNVIIVSENCNPPSGSCPSQALSWTVGAYNCTAVAPAVTSGTIQTLMDSAGGSVGMHDYRCSSGSWAPVGSGTCAGLASCPLPWGGEIAHGESVTAYEKLDCEGQKFGTVSCPSEVRVCNNGVLSGSFTNQFGCYDHCTTSNCSSATVSWTVSGQTCAAGLPAGNDGANTRATDSSAPTTGSRDYRCNSGSWTALNAGTCTAPTHCSAGTLVWQVDGHSCNQFAPLTPNGHTINLADTSGSETGTRSYFCTNGQWVGNGSGTCTVDVAENCPATSLSWMVNSNACTASVAETASGARQNLSDVTTPTTGSREYLCDDGNWLALGTGTCVTATTNASCSNETVTWEVNGASCSAGPGTGIDGTRRLVRDDSGAQTGNREYLCDDGDWIGIGTGSCETTTPTGLPCSSLPLVTWQVNGNSCQAALPSGVDTGTYTAQDTSDGAIGSRTYVCTNGNWVASNTGSCALPPPSNASCPANVLTWGVLNCSAPVPESTHGTPVTLSDNSGTSIGVQEFECNNGVWQQGSTGSCSAGSNTPANCVNLLVTWTQNGHTCQGNTGSGNDGVFRPVSDTEGSFRGNAFYTCNDGIWNLGPGASCSEVTPPTPVNGVCGSAAGLSTINPPTTNLCSSGTASSVSGSGPYSWICNGTNGGTAASCSSNRSCRGGTSLTWSTLCRGDSVQTGHGSVASIVDDYVGGADPSGEANFLCQQGNWNLSSVVSCCIDCGVE